jgi:hypothetical protein
MSFRTRERLQFVGKREMVLLYRDIFGYGPSIRQTTRTLDLATSMKTVQKKKVPWGTVDHAKE